MKEGLTAFANLPSQHRQKIQSTNPLERRTEPARRRRMISRTTSENTQGLSRSTRRAYDDGPLATETGYPRVHAWMESRPSARQG
ncbi:hypothetical protein [Streptomyces sp. NPDC006879]|uniref:hypothetical protein n=1 Tax=Streptomyces sp. NPDC006879 TaxID=3364767 RepID=UPI00367C06AA